MVLGMHDTLGKVGISHAGVCAAAEGNDVVTVAIEIAKTIQIKVATSFLFNDITFFSPSSLFAKRIQKMVLRWVIYL